MSKIKKAEITLEYQNYIQSAPVAPQSLYKTAASSDEVTVNALGHIWLKNIQENHKKYGSFAEKSMGKLFGKFSQRPAIVAGSGPSLKKNGGELKDRAGLPLLSCLHNFHFFEDRDVAVDFYVTLDAGEVTVEEVYEGGSHEPDWYWERSKGKTLLAYIGTSPRLLEKWQGEVYFFNAAIPGYPVEKEIEAVEPFHLYVSSGGNVLGACVYIAKAIFGANPIAFVGADFAFSYDKKFHGWDSKYDKNLGHVLRSVDVFGNKVLTWGSYHGFKCFFEWMSESVLGIYINCTEGGTLGAFPEGNIMSLRQMDLCDFIRMYTLHEELRAACENPKIEEKKILY